MELGHWVAGSMGYLGHLFSLGHWVPLVIIMTQCATRFFFILKHRFVVYLMFVEYFSFSLAHRIVAQALQYSFMEIKYNISIVNTYFILLHIVELILALSL